MGYRDELIDNCRLAQKALCDYTKIDAELDELHREIEVVAELSRKAIYENANAAIHQDEWFERNQGYLERHRKAMEHVEELENLKQEKLNKKHTLNSFIKKLETRKGILEEFDEQLWMVMIDKVTVVPDGRLVFCFKDGTVREIA